MEMHLRDARNNTHHQVFETGLRSCRNGDRVTIAAQAGGNPEDVHFRQRRWSLRISHDWQCGFRHDLAFPRIAGLLSKSAAIALPQASSRSSHDQAPSEWLPYRDAA